jgi:exodeoxyribonuclease V alpha subunit
MEEVFGYIDSIVFTSEESGFTVARLKEPKKRESTLLIGILPALQPGETISAKGEWKQHPKHGLQFEVVSFESSAPADLIGIQKYLESGMIKGIGPAYAGRIVQKFGTKTLEVIDETPEKLFQVAGIGEKRVERIISCWQEQRLVRTVMIFLRGHGVSPAFAQKIFKIYGEESIVKVQENPYRLAKEIFGIGFKTADRIAQNLGIGKEAKERIDAGIEYLLWELSNEGHTCSPQGELVTAVKEVLGISAAPIEARLIHLITEKSIFEEKGRIWVCPLFLAEVGIAHALVRLMSAPCSLRGVHTERALDWVQTKLKIKLAAQQCEGVSAALTEKVLIITGGPGTGKSTITQAILSITEKLTDRILLAAPTGRAAKRLHEITGKKASTIHSLLEMDFNTYKFKRGRENPLHCDLLIIDEASMIDTQLMNSLLKAVPPTARLLLVGDSDQLPSVGPGTVLKDLIDSGTIPVCILTEIFRQAKNSAIITNAHRINQGEFPQLYNGEKSDFRFIELESPEEILNEIVELVTHKLPRSHHFHKLEEIQVLAPMKRGVIGTENLNIVLQGKLNPSQQPLMRMGRRFHLGDKVMQIRNNYQKEVFNGDIGVIVEIDLSEQSLKVLFDTRRIAYDFTEIDELLLAYATSVHKYQGSECACIVMPVHSSHYMLLHRHLLYTGITRGKKLVVLVGTKRALAIAVHNREVLVRQTGLKERLQEAAFRDFASNGLFSEYIPN